jgi:hypothetical protein
VSDARQLPQRSVQLRNHFGGGHAVRRHRQKSAGLMAWRQWWERQTTAALQLRECSMQQRHHVWIADVQVTAQAAGPW